MKRLERAWYNGAHWPKLLTPLEVLYKNVTARRHQAYLSGRREVWSSPVPIIVVGNITVGGTGKSPLTAWLGRWLKGRGWQPGIISRGYGGQAPHYPFDVSENSDVAHAGDEPVMLAQQTRLPVVVDPNRPRAARRLIATGCDILLSDDGLQHHALGRDIELVVVDGMRGFGNGRCLPVGPLREPLSRLRAVDAVISNGDLQPSQAVEQYAMTLVPSAWRHLSDGVCYSIETCPFKERAHAIAGIGNPQRFFKTLETLGVAFDEYPLPDHHRFSAQDVHFADHRPVVMTAKDAVKCRPFVNERCWSLDIEACPEPALIEWLTARLEKL